MASMMLVIAAVVLQVSLVSGHGFLYEPMSRNYFSYTRGGFGYNGFADELRGGGKYKVGARNAKWPNGHPGSICGDNDSSNRWMKPGPVQRRYKAGSVIKSGSVFWNWHDGRIGFWVCQAGATKLSSARCKPLVRADGVSRYFYPPGLKRPTTSKSVPEYTDKSFTWARLPKSGTSFDQYNGTPVFYVKYRLPKGFKCNKCFLVWHYLTGNTCAPPCDRADPKKCKHGVPVCGTKWAYYPEEFWNCADISIY